MLLHVGLDCVHHPSMAEDGQSDRLAGLRERDDEVGGNWDRSFSKNHCRHSHLLLPHLAAPDNVPGGVHVQLCIC